MYQHNLQDFNLFRAQILFYRSASVRTSVMTCVSLSVCVLCSLMRFVLWCLSWAFKYKHSTFSLTFLLFAMNPACQIWNTNALQMHYFYLSKRKKINLKVFCIHKRSSKAKRLTRALKNMGFYTRRRSDTVLPWGQEVNVTHAGLWLAVASVLYSGLFQIKREPSIQRIMVLILRRGLYLSLSLSLSILFCSK